MDDEFDHLCMVNSLYTVSWQRTRYCSLPKGHPDSQPHRAYVAHNVTNNGKDVLWLGPWADGSDYKGPETDRLQEEWDNRHE